jgi:hypothetical protein
VSRVAGILAGVIGVAGYVPYIADTLGGTTKPDRISWLIWTLEYTIFFAAQAVRGATTSLWLPGLQALGALAVLALAVRHGTGALTAGKAALLGGVCLASALWYVTTDPDVALLLALAIEGAGMALTMVKTYRAPDTETLALWVLCAVAGLVDFAALGDGTPTVLFAYPTFFTLMGSGVVAANLLGARRDVARAEPDVDAANDGQRSVLPS